MWQYQHILCKWMWYNGIRVGEAQNPGPGLMQITGLNVQSLNAFIDDGRFHSGGATISVFSETCATEFVEQKASKQALAAGKHVAYGCKVPKRIFKDQRDCNTKGQARGVAILSQCPLRQCHQQWDQPIWQTSRVVDRFALTQTGPIRVVGIYGYHQGFEDSLLKNEDLLREILHRVSCIDVPTILMGDFNCDVQSLAVWHDMDRMGWIDAALLQQQWDGEQPEMTFKETSRLDYIIFNAKAVSAFQGFAVSPQPETDHKSVTAYFDWSVVPAMRMHLSMPRSLEKLQLPRPAILHATVSQTQLLALDDAIQRQDTDAAWRLFCTTNENVLDQAYHEHHGSGLPNSCKGRGKISFVNRPQSFVLTKQGREGEFNPTGDESSILLRQRIRQIRRLETYTAQRSRLQQATSQNLPTEKLQMACAATWRAILRSTGLHLRPGGLEKFVMIFHLTCLTLRPPSLCFKRLNNVNPTGGGLTKHTVTLLYQVFSLKIGNREGASSIGQSSHRGVPEWTPWTFHLTTECYLQGPGEKDLSSVPWWMMIYSVSWLVRCGLRTRPWQRLQGCRVVLYTSNKSRVPWNLVTLYNTSPRLTPKQYWHKPRIIGVTKRGRMQAHKTTPYGMLSTFCLNSHRYKLKLPCRSYNGPWARYKAKKPEEWMVFPTWSSSRCLKTSDLLYWPCSTNLQRTRDGPRNSVMQEWLCFTKRMRLVIYP